MFCQEIANALGVCAHITHVEMEFASYISPREHSDWLCIFARSSISFREASVRQKLRYRVDRRKHLTEF